MKWTHLIAYSGILCGLIFPFLNPKLAAAEIDRRPIRQTPPAVSRILSLLPGDLMPTLPAPSLQREPEYTIGLRNALLWSGDSIEMSLTTSHPGWTLLFYEITAQYTYLDTIRTRWGYVEEEADSVVFPDLPEGKPIEYRLRYYARNSSGQYGLSHWSAPQISTQDAYAPVLEKMDIVGLQQSSNASWIVGSVLNLSVAASDGPFGRVMEVIVYERSETADDTVIFDVVPPVLAMDTTLIHHFLRTLPNQSITLCLWVKDVSGQNSNQECVSFFRMPDEENRMFCFPNPFHPGRQTTVIQVSDPDAGELRIFDPFGNLVQILLKVNPSSAFFEWDGRNQKGDWVSNGGYLCVIRGKETQYCKIAVQR